MILPEHVDIRKVSASVDKVIWLDQVDANISILLFCQGIIAAFKFWRVYKFVHGSIINSENIRKIDRLLVAQRPVANISCIFKTRTSSTIIKIFESGDWVGYNKAMAFVAWDWVGYNRAMAFVAY